VIYERTPCRSSASLRSHADTITEHFNLFLSTSNCYAIFLATCRDNGYARMLEPYSDVPGVRQKIILVSPGYIALDFMKLGLPEIVWPSVFARQELEGELKKRNDRRKLEMQSKRNQLQRSVSSPAIGASTSESIVSLKLLSMVPAWNANATMNRMSQGVGVRRAQNHNAHGEKDVLQSLDDITETEEEVD
jgi:hypothetical protein